MGPEGSGLALAQGDDSLITSLDFDEDAYVEAMDSFGLSVKFEEFPVFLKVWHAGPGVWFTLSSRACLRTLFRERPAAGMYSELVAAGIRWALCERDPFFAEFFEFTCNNCSLWKRFGIRTYQDLKSRCAESLNLAMEEQKSQKAADFAWFIDSGAFDDWGDPFVEMLLSRFGPLRNLMRMSPARMRQISGRFDWSVYRRYIRGEVSADVVRAHYGADVRKELRDGSSSRRSLAREKV
jgi:hypothetical protein